MRLDNTDRSQDDTLTWAESLDIKDVTVNGLEQVQELVDALVHICVYLDGELTESIEQVKSLEAEIDTLNKEIEAHNAS